MTKSECPIKNVCQETRFIVKLAHSGLLQKCCEEMFATNNLQKKTLIGVYKI